MHFQISTVRNSTNSSTHYIINPIHHIYLKDPNAPYRASEVFEQMVQAGVQPDTMSWTILLSIWARSNLPRHEQEAQAIFDRMIAASKTRTDSKGIVNPRDSSGSSTSTLNRKPSPTGPTGANRLYDRDRGAGSGTTKTESSPGGSVSPNGHTPKVQPNAVTYTAMLKLWTHSKDPQARVRILAIYERVLQVRE